MKVLMVYPQIPVTFWSFKYILKYISKKAVYPPLGLLTVAAMLPREWDIRLVDLNVEKLRDKDLAWADAVMISAMLIQKDSVEEILSRCRKHGKKIIAGGPLFTVLADQYAGRVDHLVLDEAEATLPPFLSDLAKGQPGEIYRSRKFPSLSITPMPRWELVDIKKYATLMIQYSRGCPFNCEFCDVTSLFGFKPRVKGTGQLIAELQAIYDLGWRGNLFIVDDNFIGHKRAIKDLLRQVIPWMRARDYPFDLFTEVSINLAEDDELIRLMAEAGFSSIFIGLETPNEDSLKECSKFQNCRLDLTQAVKKLQQSGFQVSGGYIVGFDSDDEGIFARQLKFIQETGVVTAMVGLLNALPNTRLWHRLAAENRLADCSSGDNTDGTLNFIPRMDKTALVQGYRKLLKSLYSPRHYYQRIVAFLEEYRPSRKARFDLTRVRAFLKSVFYMGILGNGRTQWYYWKLFFHALIRYRKSFPAAMTMMVYGHHFRKLARKIARQRLARR
ncbi:MAG: B12-binding domain-containing radical SAM protein [Smithellaceae bacterium]|nr:B12-binding domain-containing radical SAM protein [Smithellaceae bacterium]